MSDVTPLEAGVQRCPRRDDGYLSFGQRPPEPDPTDRPDGWNRYPEDHSGERRCSYCGSLHPDDFFARVEAGEAVIPTDKNYKAYVGRSSAKVYFQHFSPDDRARFLALYNAGTMKLDTPGRFYVRPYFARPATGDTEGSHP